MAHVDAATDTDARALAIRYADILTGVDRDGDPAASDDGDDGDDGDDDDELVDEARDRSDDDESDDDDDDGHEPLIETRRQPWSDAQRDAASDHLRDAAGDHPSDAASDHPPDAASDHPPDADLGVRDLRELSPGELRELQAVIPRESAGDRDRDLVGVDGERDRLDDRESLDDDGGAAWVAGDAADREERTSAGSAVFEATSADAGRSAGGELALLDHVAATGELDEVAGVESGFAAASAGATELYETWTRHQRPSRWGRLDLGVAWRRRWSEPMHAAAHRYEELWLVLTWRR